MTSYSLLSHDWDDIGIQARCEGFRIGKVFRITAFTQTTHVRTMCLVYLSKWDLELFYLLQNRLWTKNLTVK